jgi:phage gp37-like protein
VFLGRWIGWKEVIESGEVMSRWEVEQERDFMVGLRGWSAAVGV